MRTAALLLTLLCSLTSLTIQAETPTVTVDPLTRYFQIAYAVPADAPPEIAVTCTWSPRGAARWTPARVTPLISETGLRLAQSDDHTQWMQGHLVERCAAGLTRTVVFNPYPEAQPSGVVDADFRVVLDAADGARLAEYEARLQADNRDVVYLEDWTQVTTTGAVTAEPAPEKWHWQTGVGDQPVTLGNLLYAAPGQPHPLEPLSYALDLRGHYALFFHGWGGLGGVDLRLSADERSDPLSSPRPWQEVLWRTAKMDRQSLVLTQSYNYNGWAAAHIDYLKLVPLPEALAVAQDAWREYPQDKFVAGYFEPYSWAFVEPVFSTLQHREPLIPYAEAGLSLVDIQIGRFGMQSVFETRNTDQLLHATIGDPVPGDVQPRTDNVGRMQQYTNTLDAELRYCRELGLAASANFGASNCYPGTPLQGAFSKAHPDWMRGSALRMEVPEVREYALTLYREALEIGAQSLSIDFCRYPEAVDSIETTNTLLAAMRALADEYSAKRGQRVTVLVRFPGTAVRLNEFFDYSAWIKNAWVDYLCPSNIQGRHHHIDPAPYLDAAQGSSTRVLPCLDALTWGLEFPGPYLQRVHEIYQAGATGLYVYQADGRLLGAPMDRRAMALLTCSGALDAWLQQEARLRPARSKGLYLSTPSDPGPEYHGWERLRVWTEGIEPGPIEFHLDGKLVHTAPGPPYVLGSEDYKDDTLLAPGEHTLELRAQDGDGWLEQTFRVRAE